MVCLLLFPTFVVISSFEYISTFNRIGYWHSPKMHRALQFAVVVWSAIWFCQGKRMRLPHSFRSGIRGREQSAKDSPVAQGAIPRAESMVWGQESGLITDCSELCLLLFGVGFWRLFLCIILFTFNKKFALGLQKLPDKCVFETGREVSTPKKVFFQELTFFSE